MAIEPPPASRAEHTQPATGPAGYAPPGPTGAVPHDPGGRVRREKGAAVGHELSRLKLDCPLWRIWQAGEYLYAVRAGLFMPGQGCTVYGRDAGELRREIAKAEAEAAQLACRPQSLARRERTET